jgi:hypothetical protein
LETFHRDEEFDSSFSHIRVFYFSQRVFLARKKRNRERTLCAHHFFTRGALLLSKFARSSQIKTNAGVVKDERVNYQLQIGRELDKTRVFEPGHRRRDRSQQK